MIYSYWQLQQFLILAIPVIHEIAFYYTHSVSLVVVVFVGGGSADGGCCALHLRCYCGLNSDRFMIWQFTSLSLHNISQQPRRQYFITINNVRKL